MAISDMGNLYVSHSGWDPYYTCFSISDKKIVKSHKLEPGMSHLKFINYKSTVLAVSKLDMANISVRIDDIENNRTIGDYELHNLKAIPRGLKFELKGDLLMVSVQYPGSGYRSVPENLEYIVIDLDRKTCAKIGNQYSVSFSGNGNYLLERYSATSFFLRTFIDDNSDKGIEIRKNYVMKDLEWSENANVLLCYSKNYAPNAPTLSRVEQNNMNPRPRFGVLHCDSIPRNASAVNMPSFELPFEVDYLPICHAVMCEDQKTLHVAAHSGSKIFVMKFKIIK
jgi:hypothetical protein